MAWQTLGTSEEQPNRILSYLVTNPINGYTEWYPLKATREDGLCIPDLVGINYLWNVAQQPHTARLTKIECTTWLSMSVEAKSWTWRIECLLMVS